MVLVSRDTEGALTEQSEGLLREVSTLNGLTVGISNCFTDIVDSRLAYDQARAAIRMGELMRAVMDEDGIYRYGDYASLHMLEVANRHTNLLGFCHPALRRLSAHDDRHGGELMDTLYCYLQVSGTTKRAADLLCLHKNTLLYRMNRIREILGCDLTSGEDQFVLQLSFRVLMYLGLFQPRFTTNREQLRG